MGFIDNVISGAVGYGIASASKSNPLTELIDQKINSHKHNRTLRDVVNDYAKSIGVYTSNNEFAHELHKIAAQYESYDYNYDRRF